MSQRSSMVSKSPDKGKYNSKNSNKSTHNTGSITSRTTTTTHSKPDKENQHAKVNHDVVELVNRKCALLNDKMTYVGKQINDITKEITVIKNGSHTQSNSQFNSIVSGKLENSASNSFSKTTDNEKLDSKSSILEQKINYL